MMRRYSIGIIILLFALPVSTSAQKERPKGPIIRQVDHISVDCGNPSALYRFFTETLQLPATTALTESGNYISGYIGAGNVQLEIFHYKDRKPSTARFAALAFEPYPLTKAVRELKVRGIPYDDPVSYEGALPNGTRGALWTTVGLPSYSQSDTSFFLFEYSPLFLKTDVRRKQTINRIVLQKGGPLGFESVKHILLSSTNIARDTHAWKQLLGKQDPSGAWNLGSGPPIRIVAGSVTGIRTLAFKVQSLEQAKSFLKKNRLLGKASSQSLTINPSRIQGLLIRLEE
jgi:hypothetical protein